MMFGNLTINFSQNHFHSSCNILIHNRAGMHLPLFRGNAIHTTRQQAISRLVFVWNCKMYLSQIEKNICLKFHTAAGLQTILWNNPHPVRPEQYISHIIWQLYIFIKFTIIYTVCYFFARFSFIHFLRRNYAFNNKLLASQSDAHTIAPHRDPNPISTQPTL